MVHNLAMADDPLKGVLERFKADLIAALGDAGFERAVVDGAVADFRKHAPGRPIPSEFWKPVLDELRLGAADRARIEELLQK